MPRRLREQEDDASDRVEEKQYDNRFNELSYQALSLIASYFATTPEQAVQNFGLVNKRFHDALTNHAREVWIRFIHSSFSIGSAPSSSSSSSLSTYNAFLKIKTRFKLRKEIIESKKNAGKLDQDIDACQAQNATSSASIPLLEIENCGQQIDEDDDEQVDFSFTCPVLAQNLTRLSGETTEDGLPILFCDICRKKVYTIDGSKSNEKLKEAASLGRCVSLSADSANRLRKDGAFAGSDKINIGFIVANEEQANTVSSLFHRIHMSDKFHANEKWSPYHRFKNMIEFDHSVTRPRRWTMHILNVDEFDDKENGEAKNAAAQAPEGGWTFLITFLGADLPQAEEGTTLRSLQMAGRIHKYEAPAVLPNGVYSTTLNDTNNSELLLDFEQDVFPGESFDLFWNFLEKQIIEQFRMPKGIMGQVALVQKVRLAGPTIMISENSHKVVSGGEEQKPSKGCCSQQ